MIVCIVIWDISEKRMIGDIRFFLGFLVINIGYVFVLFIKKK